MARKSNPGGRLDDLRHVLVVAGLLVAIVGTLALGAALRVDPRARGASAAPFAAPVFVPAPAAPPAPDLTDEERLEAFGQPESLEDLDASGAPPATFEAAGFTLQFIVACKPEVVARVRQALAGDPALRISPVEVAGQPCQRITWGLFEDAESARSAIQDAPQELLALTGEPLVKRLDEPRE